ncbi:hypothetical protein [Pseudomonas sp.]|uniref:hypothetical protein n=1 Tax=Pseudomonas sp. TaxID=306 RepID=UPI00258C2B9E|nr:hypothetical protein [Pseudomonas sp.]
MKARINKAVLASMQDAFIPDLASPSGLRWKRWNGAAGVRSREAGDVAGGVTTSGVYVVSLGGQKYLTWEVLVQLHRAQHRGVSV